ncbi:MAG: AAA family ATPase [Candidatus Lokiarchaeota archaeon]|nr:AAA family ATPase [Candidatus Lokiarchaeota archaeon]MBD3340725.1 AAA family ATPase [Candidatus Lokiarchaeota archaeon]
MNKIVAFTGKGGVGKTTSLVLFLKYATESKKAEDILVIDSDPDANVADVIGEKVEFCDTLGGKMKVLKDKIQGFKLSPNQPKNQLIESDVYSCLIEMDEFDLLEMGRQEGEGCYCFINDVLKKVIDTLSQNYDLTLLDSPAGLEHFARKTGRNVSDLVVVTDPSKMGIHTMKRILEITDELQLKFENIWILGNRFADGLKNVLKKEVEKLNRSNVQLLGFIPNSDEISKINLMEGNLLEIASELPPYQEAKKIFAKIL